MRWDDEAGWTGTQDASWIVVHRGDARVLVNLAATERRIPLELSAAVRVLASWGGVGLDAGDAVLPGRSVTVVTG